MVEVKPEPLCQKGQILPLFCWNIHWSLAHDKSVYGGSPVGGNAVVGVAHISESGRVQVSPAILLPSTGLCAHRDK